MAERTPMPIVIDMRCACNAELHVEVGPSLGYDFGQFMELARAWIRAHAHDKRERPDDA